MRLNYEGQRQCLLLADALKDIADASAQGAPLSSDYVQNIVDEAVSFLENVKGHANGKQNGRE